MRIVDRKTFLSMPVGTIYAKVTTPPTYDFGPVEIKGDTVANCDFYSQRLIGDFVGADDTGGWIDAVDAMHQGESRAADFDIQGRDGLFDESQLFIIFEPADVQALISRLQQAVVQHDPA